MKGIQSRKDLIMEKDKEEESIESTLEEIKIGGFDIEFGQLPTVAHHLASYDLKKVSDNELRELCVKSRTYLRLLLDKAIARCELE